MVVFESVQKEDLLPLLKKGYKKEPTSTVYEELRLKKDDTILVLYTSGKLLIQGKKMIKEVEKDLSSLHIGKKVKAEVFRKEEGLIIGSDECLKGDTFGGLVVAAVKADDPIRKKLLSLGVADSKTLSDREILPLAEKIREIAPCEVRTLLPIEYNYAGRITPLLNKLHALCAHDLLPGVHVVDKYPGCAVGDIMEEKAESKYIEVAAASIIARAAALKQFEFLSKLAGFDLPKGSTHVRMALQRLREKRIPLREFVKVDFGNVEEFL